MVDDTDRIKRKYYPPPQGDYITKEQYDEILRLERLPHYQALFKIMWGLGLRVSEALSIRPCDIDAVTPRSQGFDDNNCKHTLRLWRKGDKLHVLPLSDELRDVLVSYHHPRRIPRDSMIFPVKRRAVLARLNKYGYTVGGRKKIHPHALRRGLGVEETKKGTPLPVMQAIYNHSDLRTTLRYIGQDKTLALNHWVNLQKEREEDAAAAKKGDTSQN